MSILKRTLLDIVLMFTTLAVALFLISRFILLENLKRVEDEETTRHIAGIQKLLSNNMDNLEATAIDWASWDDTYEFVRNGNPEYIETNLWDGTFTDLQLNLMVFINTSGEIIYQKAYDFRNEEVMQIPADLQSDLDGIFVSLNENPVTGFLQFPDIPPLLIACRPVLPSKEDKAPEGVLVLGRFYEPETIDLLNIYSNSSLNFYKISDALLPDDVEEVFASIGSDNPVTTRLLDDNHIGGYLLIYDIYGQPAVIVKMETPRDIYRQGQSSVWYLLITVGVCALITGTVAVYFAKKEGISRLIHLSNTVENIGETGDISKRIEITGNDEIANLSNHINSMLKSLQELYDKEANLRHQLEQEMINRVEFTRALVHELKTPLTPIIASSDILLDEIKDELLHNIAENINSGAVRLNNRINELLDVSRGETGRMELDLSRIEPSQLLRRIVNEITPEASQRGLLLKMEIPAVLPYVKADANRLRQVLENLLDNSCKYTPAGETVTVKAEIQDGYIRIEVNNTGAGLTESEMERIFQPYYRIEKDRQRFSGLGLGLSLCKTIVELHGGKIWVSSSPGEGITFGFTIPIDTASSEKIYEDTGN